MIQWYHNAVVILYGSLGWATDASVKPKNTVWILYACAFMFHVSYMIIFKWHL